MLPLYTNIKTLRELKGMTQTELAHKCGYKDKSAIAKIERGVIDLPISKIELIATALEVSPNDLLDYATLRRAVIYDNMVLRKYKDTDDATKQVINRLLDIDTAQQDEVQ